MLKDRAFGGGRGKLLGLGVPVLRSGKSGSYFAIELGGGGILYGWELTAAATAPPGSDSPDDDLTTPLCAVEREVGGEEKKCRVRPVVRGVRAASSLSSASEGFVKNGALA